MQGRVLITGATGFVGRHLARHLAASGTPLTLAVRAAAGAEPPLGDVRVAAVGAIGSRTEWGAALDGCTAVIHAAAHVHVAPERAGAEAALFDEVNVEGSARLFAAAAAAGVRLFVFVSSVTVLGAASPPGGAFTDASPPDPRTPYARSKWSAEQRLTAAAERHPGTRLVILRPPLVCGPGVKGNLHALLRLAAAPMPLPLGAIRNRRTLLSLDNLAGAIDAVLASWNGAGTYLVGDRDPVSTSEIVAALREGLGRAPLLWPAPVGLVTRLSRLVGRPGLAQRLFGDLVVEADRFRADFGWCEVTETRASLRQAAQAFAARSSRVG